MKRGDTVIAKRNLGHLPGVPEGSSGVITGVSFLGSYTVDFGNTVLTNVKRSDIQSAAGLLWFLKR